MPARSVVVVGPLAYDDVTTPQASRTSVLGGSASYAGVAAVKHAHVLLVSVIGSDFPESDLALLRDAGIDIQGVVRRSGRTLRWSGRYGEGFASSEVRNSDLGVVRGWRPDVPAAGRGARFLFLTNTDPETQAAALDQMGTPPQVVLLDTMDEWIRDRRAELGEILRRVTVISVNERELGLLTGDADPVRGGAALLALGPEAVIVKQGDRGATLFTAGGAFVVPAYPVTVVDPTGAGDALGGAFIGRLAATGRTGAEAYREALVHGVSAASYAVQSFGAASLAAAEPAALERRSASLLRQAGTGRPVPLYKRRQTNSVEGRPLEQPLESALVERARRGDQAAYGELVGRYQALAARVAYVITGSGADAEDVTQDAFVKAYYALDRFREGAPFRPWLLRIVANEAKNRKIASGRRPTVELTVATAASSDETALSPEDAAVAADIRQGLLTAMQTLRADDRIALAYRYFLDLSEGEMAEALGIARGTVKSRLSRAMGRLREAYTDA